MLVSVAGTPWSYYGREDRVAENYAMVSLVQSGLAKVSAVARGFGTNRVRIYDAIKRYRRGGMAALVPHKRGPKGPRVLKDKAADLMKALSRQGVPNAQIAARLGVSESGIRYALGKLGLSPHRAEQLPLPIAAEPAAEPEPTTQPESAVEQAQAMEPVPATEPGQTNDSEPTLVPVPVAEPTVHGTEQAWDRTMDRALARLGLLPEALPRFGPAQGVRGAGALLALPALEASGLLQESRALFSAPRSAFYGVRTVLLTLVLMGLLRMRTPEVLRRRCPVDLGRLLGLDRAPEVKTLRRKVGALAAQQRSEELMQRLARLRAEAEAEAMGYLYVDGHVRAYHGKRRLPKTHVARIRLSMPATVDHWVNDRDGDPLFVVTATETSSLARELPEVLRQARAAVGDDRRVTVVFDRGGWSPKLFLQMVSQGFDVVTYRKGKIPPVPVEDFSEHQGCFDGCQVSYQLAERPLTLLSGKLQMREVIRLCKDGKHQTSVVTTQRDLTAVEVAYRMFERWRQENFFKYMRKHYALDALFGYGTEPGDADRLVPNPVRKAADRELTKARAEVRKLEQQLGEAACDNPEAQRPTMRGFKIANADIGRPLGAAQQQVADLEAKRRDIPARVTAKQAAGGEEVLRLDRQTKRLTDTVKMVAYQAESSLLQLIRPYYARHKDEGRSLVASALALKGDLAVRDGHLLVTLEPMASPNRTRAVAKLCEQLNATGTRYPGTELVMRYAVRVQKV